MERQERFTNQPNDLTAIERFIEERTRSVATEA